MTIIEIGAIASGLLALITLSGKIVKLITTIQSLINRLDQLQEDMSATKNLWEKTNEQFSTFDQRLRMLELGLITG